MSSEQILAINMYKIFQSNERANIVNRQFTKEEPQMREIMNQFPLKSTNCT